MYERVGDPDKGFAHLNYEADISYYGFYWERVGEEKYILTRSLGALRAPTSSLRPFGPALGPSGLLDFVLRALRALRPCDPRNDVSDSEKSKINR